MYKIAVPSHAAKIIEKTVPHIPGNPKNESADPG
jgi:hypothetical protein